MINLNKIIPFFTVLTLLLFIVLANSCNVEGNDVNPPNRYVVYVPWKATDKAIERDVMTTATHINLAFFNPDINGDFILDTSDISRLQAFCDLADSTEVKVLLSIGGGISQGKDSPIVAIYKKLLKDDNRKLLVDNVIELVELLGADGIDNDLEDICIDLNYDQFVEDLYIQLEPQGRLITAAVAKYTSHQIQKETFNKYDFINLMAYDYTGLGSNIPGPLADEEHLQRDIYYYCKTRGIDPHKLVIGLPFYGYWWKKDSLGDLIDKGAISYEKLSQRYYDKVLAEDTLIIQEDGNTITYCFNTRTTIKRKTENAAGFGGVMCWHYTMDSEDPNFSLNEAIRECIYSR